VLQRVAVCCSSVISVTAVPGVLQCTAVCCSVLPCVAPYRSPPCQVCGNVLQCLPVRCSAFHCVCCSVLQSVAVCCSVLQCVAVFHCVGLYHFPPCLLHILHHTCLIHTWDMTQSYAGHDSFINESDSVSGRHSHSYVPNSFICAYFIREK